MKAATTLSCILAALASAIHAQTVLTPVADTSFEWGINNSNYGTNNGLHVYQHYVYNREVFAYIRFDLTSLTHPITDASLRLQQKSGATINTGRIRVLGLNDVAGNTPQNWSELGVTPGTLGSEFVPPPGALTGGLSPFDTNRVTSFDDNVPGIAEDITTDAASLEIVQISGLPLIHWLESRRTNGGLATLIVDVPGAGSTVDYYLHSREATNAATAPQLSLTTHPLIRIWPLGDSITYGHGVDGGYRDPLYSNLTARSVPIKFVGTSTGNSTPLLADANQTHHDGHSGYVITNSVDQDGGNRSGLYEDVEAWHNEIETPDVILLMIGINDLNTGFQVDTAHERLSLLIERLFSYYPGVRLLVASLPLAQQSNSFRHGATNNVSIAISNYNAGVLSVVGAHRALGRKIERVDMHSVLSLTDLADGLHPNADGYAKLGRAWADAIVEPPAPNATRVRAVLLGGQSNADGRASRTGQPSHPDIDFHYNTLFDDVGREEKLTTLFPGASRWRGLGPEVSLGRRLADILGCDGASNRLAIIKHAEGGTSLYVNWKADGTAGATNDGEEYAIFQKTVANGLAALSNKYPNAAITIEGMVWMQGETDADIGKSVEYEANLNRFIADVRATVHSNLPFVVGRLSNNQSNWFIRTDGHATHLANLQASQDAVDAGDPRVGRVNTDDLGMNDPNDDIHFNTAAQVELGQRFAGELAYLLWGSEHFTPAQITAGLAEKGVDADGDESTNTDEFLAGSNPSVSNAPLRAHLAWTAPGLLSLTSPAWSNRVYTVESCTDLVQDAWIGVSSVIGDGTTWTTNLVPPLPEGTFYRIRAELP